MDKKLRNYLKIIFLLFRLQGESMNNNIDFLMKLRPIGTGSILLT